MNPKLFVDEILCNHDLSLKQFIGKRVADFDTIEDKLNTLIPLLKNAK